MKKRYEDLTDEQLLELATVLHDQPATKMIRVDKGIAFNRIVEGENGVQFNFHHDGTVIRHRNGEIQPLYNVHRFARKCQEFGLTYGYGDDRSIIRPVS